MKEGRFITIEGGEGSGKSTLQKKLSRYFQNALPEVYFTREPGGTEGAEEIRRLLLSGNILRWDALTETLLLLASRRDLLRNVIFPKLQSGHWIFCDRFIDSTLAYQGYGGGVDQDLILHMYEHVSEGLFPDLTILLDVSPEIGLARAIRRLANQQKDEGRFEQMTLAFHQKIRQGFLSLAERYKDRYVVISGEQSPEAIFQQVIILLQKRFHSDEFSPFSHTIPGASGG